MGISINFILVKYYAVKALGEIANTLGIKTLNLRNGDPCHLGILKFDDAQNPEGTNSIICDCTFNDSTTCHITELWVSFSNVFFCFLFHRTKVSCGYQETQDPQSSWKTSTWVSQTSVSAIYVSSTANQIYKQSIKRNLDFNGDLILEK